MPPPSLLAKFAARVAEIEAAVYRRRQPLPPLRLAPEGVTGPQAVRDDWAEVPVDGRWGGYGRTVWLHGRIAIPADWAGEAVLLLARLGDYHLIGGRLLIAGPEALAYLDGQPFAGVDRWHEALLLTSEARGGEGYDLSLEVYSGRIPEPHPLRRLRWRAQLPASNMWKCVLGRRLLDVGRWWLAPGNHWVLHEVDGQAWVLDAPTIELLPLAHLPFRSPEQYLGKIVQGWLAHRLRAGPSARSSPINAHWRTLYDRWLAGETPDWSALQEHALTWYALQPAPDARAYARDEITLIEDPLPTIAELHHTPAHAADPLRRLAAWTERLLDSLVPGPG